MFLVESNSNPSSGLKKMKFIATLMLVIAGFIFVYAKINEDNSTIWGYVRAGSEAAMIGALADWFAVTALFKHPLGLPIPHTAIIAKRKDQIGQSLGSFVKDNFMTSEVIAQRLVGTNIAKGVGGWLNQDENVKRVGEQSSQILNAIGEVLTDDEISQNISEMVVKKLDEVDIAPLAGKGLEAMGESGQHNILFDSSLVSLGKFLEEKKDVFQDKMYSESPWWVPSQLDDKIFTKLYSAVTNYIEEITADQQHELRGEFNTRFDALAQDLQNSPEMSTKAKEMKAQFLSHPEVNVWSSQLWGNAKEKLLASSKDPDSQFRISLEEYVQKLGNSLVEDPQLQAKVNNWITGAIAQVASQYKDEVANIISSTVESWDSKETAERLELQVGRDLQFIRINGTIVGGLAGVVIHFLATTFI